MDVRRGRCGTGHVGLRELLDMRARIEPRAKVDVAIVDESPLFGEILAAALRHAMPRLEVRAGRPSGEPSWAAVLLIHVQELAGRALPCAAGDLGEDGPTVILLEDRPSRSKGTRCPADFVRLAGDCSLAELLAAVGTGLARRKPHAAGVGLPTRPALNASQPRALTLAESRVLDFLILGQSNKEIAFGTACSEGTVKVHITNIMRKLGVHNRTQIVLRYCRTGAPKDAALHGVRPSTRDGQMVSIAASDDRPNAGAASTG